MTKVVDEIEWIQRLSLRFLIKGSNMVESHPLLLIVMQEYFFAELNVYLVVHDGAGFFVYNFFEVV